MIADGLERPSGAVLYGHSSPRIAPPVPLRSRLADFREAASVANIELMPWQEVAGLYITAVGPTDKPQFREVGVVVARQNGKTTLLIPTIIDALLHGRRVVHTAQNRTLPRQVFEEVARLMDRRHMVAGRVRYANGQEHFKLRNGGSYHIVAPTRGSSRGLSTDLVVVDELREMDDMSFIDSAKPTMTASKSPQMVYLSNAGTAESMVLNAIRARADSDANLAYLEWSTDPERQPDDPEGWAQSNPAMGHMPEVSETLAAEYTASRLSGTMASFETEHLCRWVDTLAPVYVNPDAWHRLHGQVEEPHRPYMAVSMAPSGDRATAVLAWRLTTGRVGVRIAVNAVGSPIDVDALGADLKKLAASRGVVLVGFDPWTDADIARRLPKTKALAGRDFAAASENFARRVSDGSITWDEADQVGLDLGWTTRKQHESGAYHAVRSSDEHSITAALAAIRAVWLATNEKPPSPKVL